jgi:transcriptional regulator with XRE-family HTH domain
MPSPTALTHEVRQAFSEWFKKRRNELGLSQEAVAEVSGLSRQQIIRIEKAESGTTRESAPGLARALQVSEEILRMKAGLAGEQSSGLDIPPELVDYWRMVPEKKRTAFLKQVRGAAELAAF